MRIRIPFTDIIVTREATIAKEIADGGALVAVRKASEIIRRYSRNRSCLRAALAARFRMNEEHLFDTLTLLENEQRAVEAFADAMGRERGELPIIAVRPEPARYVHVPVEAAP
ncbi:MAG: hypothetical protein KF723_22445 [Rhizobiaceae bacterium]|nr:hypothetical protein [Rhizobiaceae bacterium]